MIKNKDITLSSLKPDNGSTLSRNKEIKKLLDMGVQRGYLTYEEVNELMPPEVITSEAIDEVMNLLSENEIEVIDSAKRPKESEDDDEGDEAPIIPGSVIGVEESEESPVPTDLARGADPVKLYLKKMGSVSLLTREGEVEIAKRIEEGEVDILRALLASKLGTLAIVDLGERLETGRTKVKDVIRGVDEEVSLDDEKKYLEKVLAAIAKVKVLLSEQEKLEEKTAPAESKKAHSKSSPSKLSSKLSSKDARDKEIKESVHQEIKKRERLVEAAFQDIAFNRKTINFLSGKIKGFWGRGKDLLEEGKKIYDFLGIQAKKEIEELIHNFKKDSSLRPALCKKI